MDNSVNSGQRQAPAIKKTTQQRQSAASSPESGIPGCPSCGAAVPEGAKFCEACGAPVEGPKFCPSCGAQVNPIADICEACGTWLLDGQCKFCYAPLESGAAFCPECGNPQAGIACPSCGKLNAFDFCSSCNTPLTDAARQASASAHAHPQVMSFLAAAAKATQARKAIAELDQAAAELEKELLAEGGEDSGAGPSEPAGAPPEADPVSSFFSDEFLENVMGAAGQAQSQEAERARQSRQQAKLGQQALQDRLERQRAQQSRLEALREQRGRMERDQADAAAQVEAASKALQAIQFTTHQEARCFANAFKPDHCKGWLCNYAGVIHASPNECAEPGQGGVWLTDSGGQ